jgi:hypothetical protein
MKYSIDIAELTSLLKFIQSTIESRSVSDSAAGYWIGYVNRLLVDVQQAKNLDHIKRKHGVSVGAIQVAVLRSLVDSGKWHDCCGWVWDTPSGTKRAMDSLARKGLASFDGKQYTPTSLGKEILKTFKEMLVI